MQSDKCVWSFSIAHKPNDKPLIQVSFKRENKTFQAKEISSMVLHNMKEISQQYLSCLVNKFVIIVPAYYNDSQSQTTKIAMNIAGLDVLQILNEPTVAAVPGASSRRLPPPFHLILLFFIRLRFLFLAPSPVVDEQDRYQANE
jgi:heat shock protein 1/8